MADNNIALGVKQPEPVNYLGQMAQVMGIKAMQDEMSGSEGVRSAIRGGMSPTDAKLLQYGKRGEAVYKAGLAGEKESLAATESRFGLMGQVFGYVKDNPTLENANAALDKLGQYGVLTPEAVAQSKAQVAADPSKIVTYATQLFNDSIKAEKQQADATSRRNNDTTNATSRANNAATVGAAYAGQRSVANTAANRLEFDRNAMHPVETGAGTGFYSQKNGPIIQPGFVDQGYNPNPTANALAPAPQPSMVNNMLADKTPTAMTSVMPPVMSSTAFDTAQTPPAPAASQRFTRATPKPVAPVFEGEYLKGAGKYAIDADTKLIDSAKDAVPNIAKLDEIQKYINSNDVTTGFGADLIKNINRARAQFTADVKAGKQASDTEILDSMLGAGVFPMIQSLGIGARGMDTPAEREFLRGVMTGTISMNKDTLTKLTKIRRDLEVRAVDKYNQAVETGGLDNFVKASGRKQNRIDVPAAPTGAAANSVTTPDGMTHNFPDAASAAAFKKAAGL